MRRRYFGRERVFGYDTRVFTDEIYDITFGVNTDPIDHGPSYIWVRIHNLLTYCTIIYISYEEMKRDWGDLPIDFAEGIGYSYNEAHI